MAAEPLSVIERTAFHGQYPLLYRNFSCHPFAGRPAPFEKPPKFQQSKSEATRHETDELLLLQKLYSGRQENLHQGYCYPQEVLCPEFVHPVAFLMSPLTKRHCDEDKQPHDFTYFN